MCDYTLHAACSDDVKAGSAQSAAFEIEAQIRVTELIRSNDIVLIGFARSLLEGAEIPVLVADEHMSALEGSIGAFGRRLLVPDDHRRQARRILIDAGLERELRDDRG